LQGAPAVDAPRAQAQIDLGICRMRAVGRARGRLSVHALAKKQPPAVLSPGLGAWHEQPLQPLPAPLRAF
jgi:hypothetical protein